LRLRANDTADNPAEDSSTCGIAVVVMVMMVVILGKLHACRLLQRARRIVGF